MKTKIIKLSILVSVIVVLLKAGAYLLTGSVSLLSDAMESIVNVVAACTAYFALRIAAKPPDQTHQYGHEKAEYLSSIVEGSLILVAAFAIAQQGITRLFNLQALESLGWGMAVSMLATLFNFVMALALLRVGKKEDSIALEADGKHLMTDVYTSVGVFIGLCLVLITGWLWLDPAIAILVAANIVFEGGKLIKRSIDGLMDRALPQSEEKRIREIIEQVLQSSNQTITYHGLRTRKSGHYRFADMHLLVPGNASLVEAHEWSEKLEKALTKQYPNIRVLIHEEPVEDPRAYLDNWESTKKI